MPTFAEHLTGPKTLNPKSLKGFMEVAIIRFEPSPRDLSTQPSSCNKVLCTNQGLGFRGKIRFFAMFRESVSLSQSHLFAEVPTSPGTTDGHCCPLNIP